MDFLAKIKTTEEMDAVVSQIDALKRSLFVKGPGLVPPAVLGDDFALALDKDAFLSQARAALLVARVMELTIAKDLPEESIERLALWVKENVGQDILLRINVEFSVGAGALITFAGKFKDYSYKDELAAAIKNITV